MLTVDYDLLDVRPGMRVLDLGCGEGRHAFEAYRRGADVLAVDWGQHEVATTAQWLGAIAAAGEAPAGARAAVARGDLRALPVPDASVDRVIASEVLEHIVDDRTAIAEIARVLRPGGRVAVTVPATARSGSAGRCRTTTTPTPAGTSASTAATSCPSASPPPGCGPPTPTTPTPCTPLIGGSSAPSASTGTPRPPAPTTGCWSGT